jgi:hypothetical protein
MPCIFNLTIPSKVLSRFPSHIYSTTPVLTSEPTIIFWDLQQRSLFIIRHLLLFRSKGFHSLKYQKSTPYHPPQITTMASSLLPRLRPATVLTTVLAGGIATGIYSKFIMRQVHADSGPKPKKVLGGGPAFLSLPLESSEMVSGDTKRLRFKLPTEDDVSGLPLTCKSSSLAISKNMKPG